MLISMHMAEVPMFIHENALLIGGSYFFVMLLVLPGLLAWKYQNNLDQKEYKPTPRVIPTSGRFESSSKAA
jgi:hypothetical protein